MRTPLRQLASHLRSLLCGWAALLERAAAGVPGRLLWSGRHLSSSLGGGRRAGAAPRCLLEVADERSAGGPQARWGGADVFVTGDWCAWAELIPLRRDPATQDFHLACSLAVRPRPHTLQPGSAPAAVSDQGRKEPCSVDSQPTACAASGSVARLFSEPVACSGRSACGCAVSMPMHCALSAIERSMHSAARGMLRTSPLHKHVACSCLITVQAVFWW